MRIDVLTLFPELFREPLQTGLLGKACSEGLINVCVWNIREFATDTHKTVDDAPFGGGPGMIMKCEPIFNAFDKVRAISEPQRVILMSPRGRRLTQNIVKEVATASSIVIICGRYGGVDERVSQALCADELSIGDYVLSGGELPALVLIEALSRMVPGVVGKWESVESDSFYRGILGPPQYTRPAVFRGMEVPSVLREGNHEAIAKWRQEQAMKITRERRPDLLEALSEEQQRELEKS
ncbi:MAG TPA: tRNA (guanosine(37)-N1)-methyltransferase TrmD [Candidatus Hydrogenedentes bacterium]|nr:tRNA (guanosine(37)-N1)-methyltransferase TrmD [Candidatus Hydrogenedentota bacterium]HOL75392.1 tRNA (guanosine(37)-N1)-methyltransferase TrmD [Candidatus Hydrogenedentota bacterium]HPO84901.1 tRNA (guanosine(37)-N1)-methyltransferase TrmD [Candidatus Hydrogenedentota bacterium]